MIIVYSLEALITVELLPLSQDLVYSVLKSMSQQYACITNHYAATMIKIIGSCCKHKRTLL